MNSRLGYWINERGLKQKFVAQQMSVSQEMVSKWINNKSYPRADKLYKLADLLEVKVDDLYERGEASKKGHTDHTDEEEKN